ncbi:Lysine-specific demethylase 3B [Morus notabilis]|uniref:Lysine-specific demethylase 3B n=1 Tax=Morus notabilis TaxID=981085 RepID=W9QH15_9ROSA|nr:Lysine-specific demethylase 3B [Morus notabilis]
MLCCSTFNCVQEFLITTLFDSGVAYCSNFCRIPIIDYHRHCANCSYDLCLSCCRDLQEASTPCINGVVDNKIGGIQEMETLLEQPKIPRVKQNFSDKFPDWKANGDGSIPCPPKDYGGCGYPSLNLSRIFKMNWVAKLVKNVEEMVSGCRVYNDGLLEKTEFNDHRHCQYAHREDDSDNFLFCPTSEDIKSGGIGDFRKHWARGEPIIVNQVFDSSSVSSWDPMAIWRGMQETTEEKLKDESRIVKAIDCFDWSEVDIELGQFIKGYYEGRIDGNGQPEILKLKDWPSPSASEEFLLYQRPEYISKLPLLEYIHSKWGLLNVAAKLPHYSLQNDVGPKIFISYGTYEELGRGNCVTNLHFNIRDMVYLLVHTCEAKLNGQQRIKTDNMHNNKVTKEKDLQGNPSVGLDEGRFGSHSLDYEYGTSLDENKDERMMDQEIDNSSSIEGDALSCELSNRDGGDVSVKTHPGVLWDVFRRRDVPQLIEYLRRHQTEFSEPNSAKNDFVTKPLYDERYFLNRHQIRKLKKEFGIEPWSFEQHPGQAVFVPAGCPFQVRNLQEKQQEQIADLLNVELEHKKKNIKENQIHRNWIKKSKYLIFILVLFEDMGLGSEVGFEDPNLTAAVSENMEKMPKRRQITCA